MRYLIAILADDEALADLLDDEAVQVSPVSILAALLSEMEPEDRQHVQIKVSASEGAQSYFDSIAADAAS